MVASHNMPQLILEQTLEALCFLLVRPCIACGTTFRYTLEIVQQGCSVSGARSEASGSHLRSKSSMGPKQVSGHQGKQADHRSTADKEVVIEVDWSLGQAAPHVATITAQSTPLSWKLQAALELTMCAPLLQVAP